jgi:hypothetical protein
MKSNQAYLEERRELRNCKDIHSVASNKQFVNHRQSHSPLLHRLQMLQIPAH